LGVVFLLGLGAFHGPQKRGTGGTRLPGVDQVLGMNKADKWVGATFKVMIVLNVLVIGLAKEFRPDIYKMVSIPVEVFTALLLVYIGGKWLLTKFGFSNSGSIKINKRASIKAFAFVAALMLFSVFVEYIAHNLSLTQEAIADLRTSQDGRTALGEPIRVGWFISGSQRSSGDGGGVAGFSIPVKGSKASGKLEMKGIRKDGLWHISELYLTVGGNGGVVQIPH
jgi:Cytochrome oxidase complex assembly protein 1